MKQKLLNEVAISLSRKIRNRGKVDPIVFQSACQTFMEIIRMTDEEAPAENTIKQLRQDLNRVMAATGVE